MGQPKVSLPFAPGPALGEAGDDPVKEPPVPVGQEDGHCNALSDNVIKGDVMVFGEHVQFKPE